MAKKCSKKKSPMMQVSMDPSMTMGQMPQMTNVPPQPSSLVNPFDPRTQMMAQGYFGNQSQRQTSVNAPLMFKDQTGDGKITQADVLKARIEGYEK